MNWIIKLVVKRVAKRYAVRYLTTTAPQARSVVEELKTLVALAEEQLGDQEWSAGEISDFSDAVCESIGHILDDCRGASCT